MNWNRLPNVPRDDQMPAATLSKTADKLDQSFAAITERRQEFDQQQAAVRERPVESVDVFGIADRLRQVRHGLLRDELKARKTVDGYIADFRAWSGEAAGEAFAELEKSRTAVRKKLVRAGFIDCLPTEMIAGKIQPGMVSQHPAVIAARTRHDEV